MCNKIEGIIATAIVASFFTLILCTIVSFIICVLLKYPMWTLMYIVLFIPTYNLIYKLIDETYNSKEE